MRVSRRDLLNAAARISVAMSVADPLQYAKSCQRRKTASADDLVFASATDAIRAIRRGRISAVELTELMYKRIDAVNPRLNAVVVQMREYALSRAREADRARAQGSLLGPLHGVPFTIKDTFETKGEPITAGNPAWRHRIATRNAPMIARLEQAGAIPLGITNVPYMLSDYQSYNAIYGQTNNPWDLSRTPGGSTGGGAAAVAAGIGYLATGSDSSGSIRVPAHFCGVYGHKPTIGLVSGRGTLPPPFPPFAEPHYIGVYGMLARCAEDLALSLNVIGGPEGEDALAYRWALPPPRRQSLRDYRIGYVVDDKLRPVSSDERQVFTDTIATLRRAGFQLTEGWPAGFVPEAAFRNYFFIMRTTEGEVPAGASLEDFMAARKHQLNSRAIWQDYFRTHDAFLMPAATVPAFPHDHSEPVDARVLHTVDGPRPYFDLLFWPSFAAFTGHPATVAPVGLTSAGLPVGLQIVGPYLEDATPIDVAAKMGDFVGGYQIPRDI